MNKRVQSTEDTLDCYRKIRQAPNIVKFIFLYYSWYPIYLNSKNHKVQHTYFEFISNILIVLDAPERN